jgi:hypothetical protein
MTEPKRMVTVELVNPSSPSWGDPLTFWNSVVQCWSYTQIQRSTLDCAANCHGWPPCRFATVTATDPQFVELFCSAFDDPNLGDLTQDHSLTPCRSVRRFRYGNIQTRRALRQGLDQ